MKDLTVVKVFSVIYIALAALSVFLGIGWIINLVKVIASISTMTNMEILRIVGLFAAPLGGILGWM